MKTTIKRTLILAVTALGANFTLPQAYAGGGSVSDKFEANVSEALTSDGLRTINVRRTVVTGDEIKYMDLGRRFVLETHGEVSKNWPIMVDFESHSVMYLNRDQDAFVAIPFTDLK